MILLAHPAAAVYFSIVAVDLLVAALAHRAAHGPLASCHLLHAGLHCLLGALHLIHLA